MSARVSLRVLVLLVTVVGALAVGTPAQASVSGSTSTGDLVLYDQCQTHTIDYSIQVTPDTTYWELEIQAVDPNGLFSQGTAFNSSNAKTSGSATVYFCGSETPGTWKVRATGFYETLIGARTYYSLPDTRFEVRAAATRTGLRARALGHGRYRMTATVMDQRPGGFGPTQGATVRLERLVDGAWRPIARAIQQTNRGHAVIGLVTHRRIQVRAVTSASGNYAGSVSRSVRV